MPKFFIPYPISKDESKIEIHDEDSRHIRDVLRIKAGEAIIICDTNGIDYQCVVDSFERDAVVARILARIPTDNESPFEIVIFQGLPKADKMETIIQKCVELGGVRIVPVSCIRSIARLDEKKDMEKKLLRWNKIAYEAAKQCNRNVVPRIDPPVSFKAAIAQMTKMPIAFIPWECEEKKSVKTLLKQAKDRFYINNQDRLVESEKELQYDNKEDTPTVRVKPVLAFIVGPEGGFDQAEIDYARQNGIDTVTLGKRILRTETASPSILAMILYEMEL